MTRVCAIETALSISAVAPARLTIALSSRPEAIRVARKPFASDRVATNTATVPAMPRTATSEPLHRSRRLSRL